MFTNQSIERKLIAIILLTSGAVILIACGTFVTYELVTARQTTARDLSTVGRIVAANNTAALAFVNHADATELLSALSADPAIVAASLYDEAGALFARFPAAAPDETVPALLQHDGFVFADSHLVVQEPVVNANRRLGSLVLKSDLRKVYQRLSLYGGLAIAVVVLSGLAALPLSRRLQRHISFPILALAGTASSVTERGDYSVRATRFGDDEVGQLVDAFNAMLAQVEAQDAAARHREGQLRREVAERIRAEEAVTALNASLERRVEERTAALSESEARHHTLLAGIDEGFCIIQMMFDAQRRPVDYRFLEVNPSFERHGGIRDARGKTIRELVPDMEEHWFERFGRVALTGQAERFQERAEPLHRWFDVHASRFGEPGRDQVTVVFTDITERKAAEDRVLRLNDALRQRAAQLEEANQELDSFSYSVSHDLRAPLRHIHGYVEMLHRATAGQLTATAQRYLTTIAEACIDMGQLIDDLLAFSRMAKTDMSERPVDLEAGVRQAIRDHELSTRGRHIAWEVASLPAVIGDAAMLKQVLANLIGNALKYSRTRDPARIAIGCAGEEGGRAILFVRDNGAGFDMQYAHKLFGVFQRLHRSEEFEGTGIGLATVRRIVARHGGRVWAEGAPDRGATFYFTLKPVSPAGGPVPSRTERL